MKRYQLLTLFAILAAAALFGWILPETVFRIEDAVEGRKLSTAQIRQIDLNYQSDLDIAARLRFIQEPIETAVTTPLQKGVYLQKQDAAKIAEQFLLEATGYQFVLQGRSDLTPMISAAPAYGTMIVWVVHVSLNETWNWEAMIDDQTGLILKCSFFGSPNAWDSLFHDFGGALDSEEAILHRLSEAFCRHFEARTSSAFTAGTKLDFADDFYYTGTLLLTEGTEEYRMPFELSLPEGFISFN